MKLIHVQLEVCHANSDGVSWYGYFRNLPTGPYIDQPDQTLLDECAARAATHRNGGSIELSQVGETEEVPTEITKETGLRRFYVGQAC